MSGVSPFIHARFMSEASQKKKRTFRISDILQMFLIILCYSYFEVYMVIQTGELALTLILCCLLQPFKPFLNRSPFPYSTQHFQCRLSLRLRSPLEPHCKGEIQHPMHPPPAAHSAFDRLPPPPPFPLPGGAAPTSSRVLLRFLCTGRSPHPLLLASLLSCSSWPSVPIWSPHSR